MIISIIVVMDRRGLIGNDQGLPWKLSADLRRFRKLTMGKPIIMGRTTHEMIGGPLDGRPNLVLTRNPDYRAEGCITCFSLDQAMETAHELLKQSGGDEVMIIGGALVYEAALSQCQRLHLTIVEGEFSGTAYFPVEWLRERSWRVLRREEHPVDAKNPHAHVFLMADKVPDGEPLTLTAERST